MRVFHERFIAWVQSAQAYTKFWVAFLGGVLIIVTQSVAIPEDWSRWITTGIALATAFSVFQFPNKVPPVDPGE